MGLAYLENGRVVMIAYLCIKASSTVRSSLKFLGVYFGLSFLGVLEAYLSLVFIPMSRRWRAKMSLNSTMMESRFSRSSPVISESFHLNLERNCDLERSSCLESSCSSFCGSRSSLTHLRDSRMLETRIFLLYSLGSRLASGR